MSPDQKYMLGKIQEINAEFLKETELWLLKVYHLVLHDQITPDDICEIGERFGLDIEESYVKMVDIMIEEEGEDDQ